MIGLLIFLLTLCSGCKVGPLLLNISLIANKVRDQSYDECKELMFGFII